MFQLPFIDLPYTEDVFTRLNRGLRLGGIVLMGGAYATGKSRLLQQLVLEHMNAFDRDQLAGIRLSRPKKLDTGRHGSTVTLDLFSKLYRDLRLLFTVSDSEERALLRDKLQDEPRLQLPIYSDDRFYDLFYKVGDIMTRVRVFIVDNAQYLDDITLDRLLELWAHVNYRFGIVLCIRLETNESMDARKQRIFGSNPQARSACLDSISVPQITPVEFADYVLPPWLNALDARFAPALEKDQVQFLTDAWAVTLGDWMAMSALTTLFKDELDQQARSPRLITKEVAKRVFDQRRRILA